MIVTEIYNGQGLGNQLFCYATTRTIALDNNYQFGIINGDKFKCLDFMDLDMGCEVIGGYGPEGGPPIELPNEIVNYYVEKNLYHPIFKCDIREYDKNLIDIKDNTKIDGVMQSENYFYHRKEEIKKWFKIKPEKECYDFSNENICIINFRGGEYRNVADLFLNKEYWYNAMKHMLKINKNFRFVVITDDVSSAKNYFPNLEVYHFDIAKDYSIIKNANYLIMSNSSFAFFPVFTSESLKFVIGPKYWARHNISDGFWSCGYNIYRNIHWLGRDNILYNYDECLLEHNEYKLKQYGKN